MKTIIQGKNIKTTYGVDSKQKTIKNGLGEDVVVYTGKPKLKKNTEIDNWETIKEFNEKIGYNSRHAITMTSQGFTMFDGKINLSEDESINVLESITRVDLGAYVLRTDKVLKEEEVNKVESERELRNQIREFNKMIIESDENLLAYCKLHHLIPASTDVDELFKVVYPNNNYRIDNGKLVIGINKNISADRISFVDMKEVVLSPNTINGIISSSRISK